MKDQFLTFIRNENLFFKRHKVLLAVSGGVDSVVMVELFRQTELQFAIAHCNFQLRGEDADEDEKFVKELAHKIKVPCYSIRFETEAEAKKNRESIQITARKLRYEWFNKIIKEHQFDYIATAHHANDQVETIYYNLTKGTGIEGLHGILPKAGKLVRPLMTFKRSQIEAFAENQHLEWREDKSNQSLKYSRNLIRQKVVPVLKQLNPSLEKTSLETASKLKDTEDFLFYALEKLKPEFYVHKSDKEVYDIKFLSETPGHKSILYYCLRDQHFSYDQIKNIFKETQQGESNKHFKAGAFLASLDYGKLTVSKEEQLFNKDGNNIPITIDHLTNYTNQHNELSFSKIAKNQYEQCKDDQGKLFVDLNKIKMPLKWRYLIMGDIFNPLGMKGMKKVTKFLKDNKVSADERAKVTVLEDERAHIIAVLPFRIDERVKIDGTTTDVLEINCTFR